MALSHLLNLEAGTVTNLTIEEKYKIVFLAFVKYVIEKEQCDEEKALDIVSEHSAQIHVTMLLMKPEVQ